MIEVAHLNKSFEINGKRLDVLREIDLTLQKGEVAAIVGASGAGKSTFLHILGALDRPTSGTVLFDGVDLFQQTDEQLDRIRNERVGFVFQFHHLLPDFTALENVMMPGLIRNDQRKRLESEARALLARVGLSDRLFHKPAKLSGGEQQRVAVARALILRPSLVLADEPTGNLDTQTSQEVFSLLRELNREDAITFVLVTHNEKLAAQADRVVKMADGRLEVNADPLEGLP
jgi:lipoprotein-releasing system ATP-binding protein